MSVELWKSYIVRIVPFNSNDLPPLLMPETWKLKIVSIAAFWACKNVIYLVCSNSNKNEDIFLLKSQNYRFPPCNTALQAAALGIWNDSIVRYDCARSRTVALIYFCTLRKWSAILGLSFSAWCWLPRRSWPRSRYSLGHQHHAEKLSQRIALHFRKVRK